MALRAVQRSDRRRQARDSRDSRDYALLAADVSLGAAAVATVGAGMYLAGRGGSRAWSGIKTRLAERADAEEQRLAARNTVEEVDTERKEAKGKFLRAAQQERASAPERVKKAIEVAEANEKREEAALIAVDAGDGQLR